MNPKMCGLNKKPELPICPECHNYVTFEQKTRVIFRGHLYHYECYRRKMDRRVRIRNKDNGGTD